MAAVNLYWWVALDAKSGAILAQASEESGKHFSLKTMYSNHPEVTVKRMTLQALEALKKGPSPWTQGTLFEPRK